MLLFKKAIRSMLGNKRAYIACIWLMAAGVTMYVAMSITSVDLHVGRDWYFSEYRLADVFADVRAAGASVVPRLTRIPGVADAAVRRVEDCRVDLPGSDKIVTLRIISYDPGADNPINGAEMSGTFHADNDLFIFQSFLDAHNLEIGDELDILLAGQRVRFNIAGTAESPEYAYAIPSSTEFMPDPAKFNIAYAAEKPLNNYFGTPNLYNSIGIMLEEGYEYSDVSAPLRDELHKYGLLSIYEQADQASTLYVDMEITAITAMSSVVPMALCVMAMVILYLMLKRVIEQDRSQIGTMKAFGFSNTQIVGHYMFYGIVTGALGSIFGLGLGFLISGYLSDLMRFFFNIPEVTTTVDTLPIFFTGLAIGIGSGALGAFMGALRVIRMLPAEAMRPEAPKPTKHDPLRFLPGFKLMLTSLGAMAVRNIVRAKVRSLFIILSISISFGILAFFGSYPSMIDNMMFAQFTKSEIYDLKASFRVPVSAETAVDDARRYQGVRQAEAILELPAQLVKNARIIGAPIVGIPADSQLFRIYDERTRSMVPPSSEGLVMAKSVADRLGVRKGDTLTVRSPYLKEDIKLCVAGIATRSLGGVYMERDALAEAFNMRGLSTAVIMNADDVPYIKEELKGSRNVASVVDAQEAFSGFEMYMGMTSSMLVSMFVFGVIIAFVIIYSTSTISFSERQREFATFRVLGLTVPEIGSIQGLEYWFLAVFGVALGVPYASMIMSSMNALIDLETFALPDYIEPQSYMLAFVGVVAAVFISNRASRKKIRQLDMVEALKERE